MPLPSSIDLIYGQSSVMGITSTGFVLKILPAGVEIFSANIVYVKDPELSSSNRIGRFGMGMSQNTEEAGKREERENTLTKKVRSTGSMNQGKRIFPVSAWRIFPDELHTRKEIPVFFFFRKKPATNQITGIILP